MHPIHLNYISDIFPRIFSVCFTIWFNLFSSLFCNSCLLFFSILLYLIPFSQCFLLLSSSFLFLKVNKASVTNFLSCLHWSSKHYLCDPFFCIVSCWPLFSLPIDLKFLLLNPLYYSAPSLLFVDHTVHYFMGLLIKYSFLFVFFPLIFIFHFGFSFLLYLIITYFFTCVPYLVCVSVISVSGIWLLVSSYPTSKFIKFIKASSDIDV